jgi:SPP1 gp7 family putative phage head morphogenesis protein
LAGQPIIPRSIVNPVGQTDRITRVYKQIVQGLDDVEAWLLETWQAVPVLEVVYNAVYVNATRYEYQINVYELERIVQEIAIKLGLLPNDYVVRQVAEAYADGTNQAATNLANISDDYTREITQILVSDPYQRRVALAGARAFENMKGFEGDTGLRLGRIIRQAVQDSRPPLAVAEDIQKEFGIARNRAETIARSEVQGALRRGRWDEAQDAQERLGLRVGLLWISALKPTTRLWHADRHGSIYTVQQVRDFYAVDGNAINCYCTQTEIPLNAEGKPLSDRAVLRLKKQKQEYFS